MAIREIGDEETQRALELLGIFVIHNPYNFRAHAMSFYDLVDSINNDNYLSDQQKDMIMVSILWHLPPVAVHTAMRLGFLPAVSGGFGYYKSLSMFPMLAMALGYQQLGYTVAEMPSRVISATGGTGGAYKPPGSNHWAFRNPVTGM